ncbi:hypothetical protein MHK_005177 [Candidatus Magnetomorum sp. HK-1]|nr:hypothetical protein MHK_005177 [Candidatus Magnetomorum sp. HK-1]
MKKLCKYFFVCIIFWFAFSSKSVTIFDGLNLCYPFENINIVRDNSLYGKNFQLDNPTYRLGFLSSHNHIHVAGSILSREWKKQDSYFQGMLFTFKITSLLPDGQIGNVFKRKGFKYQPADRNDSFIADLNQNRKNTVPLLVRVYGFSSTPPALTFVQKIKRRSKFIELSKDSFTINNQTAWRMEIGGIQSGRYPVVFVYFGKSLPQIEKNVTVTSTIDNYEQISTALTQMAYLEYINNNVIIDTSPVNQKVIQRIFTEDELPTSVQFRTRLKTIKAVNTGYHSYTISLDSLTNNVIVRDYQDQPVEGASVNVYVCHKHYICSEENSFYSFFSFFKQLFFRPSQQFYIEKIALSSGKTNQDGIASFIGWGYPLGDISVDVFKAGYQYKENIPLISLDFPLTINLDFKIKPFKTAAFKYDSCMNEDTVIHQSGGQLEIFDNGKLLACLHPEDGVMLPLTNYPNYRFKHQDYNYQEVFVDQFGFMRIIPQYKILRQHGQKQVLIVMDVTDDDPRGTAFLKTTKALVKYLRDIQWDYLPTSKKYKVKVASAYHEHLNFFSKTDDIDNNILMIQADSSLTEQLKKAFGKFDKQIEGIKKVIYIISSRRASVIVDDYLVNHLDIRDYLKKQKVFSAIVVGSYAGLGLKELSKSTNGKFFYCKTSEDIYARLNEIVGTLESKSSVIPCLYNLSN